MNIEVFYTFSLVILLVSSSSIVTSKTNELLKKIKQCEEDVENIETKLQEVASQFMTAKNQSLSSVTQFYDKLHELIATEEEKFAGFQHILCRKEENNFNSFNYDQEISDQLVEEDSNYNTQYETSLNIAKYYKQELSAFQTNVTKCTEDTCVDKLDNEFDKFKAEEIDNNNILTDLQSEITIYNTAIYKVTNEILDTISNFGQAASECLQRLTKSKNNLDALHKFFNETKESVVAKILETKLDFKKNTEKNSVEMNMVKIKLYDLLEKIEVYEKRADESKADVKTCEENKDKLLDLKEEILVFLKITMIQENSSASNIANGTIECITHKTIFVSQDLLEKLSNCTDELCENQINVQAGEVNRTLIAEDVKKQSDKSVKRIGNLETEIVIKKNKLEENFSKNGTKYYDDTIGCLRLETNKAELKTIEGYVIETTLNVTNILNEIISIPTRFANDWLHKQFENELYVKTLINIALQNVTYKEIEAKRLSLNVSKCISNKTIIQNDFLQKFSKNITESVSAAAVIIDDKANTSSEKLVNLRKATNNLLEVLYTCRITDDSCVENVKKTCEDETKVTDSKSKYLVTVLQEKVKLSDNDIQMKVNASLSDIYRQVSGISVNMINCIQKEIDNSSVLCSPSVILLLAGLFLQTYLRMM